MTRLYIVLISLLGLTTAGWSKGSLHQAIWGCAIPCETASGKSLRAIHFTWCSTIVLTSDMLNTVSSMCQKANHDPTARAVRYSKGIEMAASCSSSGNTCEQEGPTYVGYSCTLSCEKKQFFRYAACASNIEEAWELATKICPNPHKPEFAGWAQVCEANDQTPCTP